MRLLLVHGRGQGGKNPAELTRVWLDSLARGFAAAGVTAPAWTNVDFPYYGDALDRLSARKDLPSTDHVAAKGPGQDGRYAEFLRSALEQLQQRANVPDAEVRAELAADESQQKGPQNWSWVRAMARALDRRFTGASSFAIEAFLRDVFLYVGHRDVAREIDAIVSSVVTTEPTLVVSHSLGTVVAYNALRKHSGTMNVTKFITVGSPLGIRAISSKLGVVSNPAAGVGWFNAFDERDIVALNPLDDVNFPVNPKIDNHGTVDNQTDNRHGIIGYLDDARVARVVAEAGK